MNLTQATSADLRGMIVKGDLPPGAAVTESWVCDRFGVARPTAKSAIDRLVNEGVLQREVNRSAKVPLLTREQVDDLYEARLVVEAAAVQRVSSARHITPALRRAQKLMAVSTDDLTDFTAADVDFHRELVRAAGSPRLIAMHDLVIGETQMCMARVRLHELLPPGDILADHEQILAAVEHGDTSHALELLARHIGGAKQAVLTSIADG